MLWLNSRKRIVFLTVETKVRELDAKILLATCLANLGYFVYVGHKPGIEFLAKGSKNAIFLDKSAAVSKLDLFCKLKKLDHRLVVMDEEGLLILDEHIFQVMRLSRDSLNLIDIYIAWGNNQKRIIEHAYPDWALKILPLGNPRIDLVFPSPNEYLITTPAIVKSLPPNFILIMSKFGTYNIAESSDELLESEVRAGLIQNEIDKESRANYFVARAALFNEMVDLVRSIRTTFPEEFVVIRPHPSESGTLWSDIFGNDPGILISNKGNVHDWINAAGLIIHNGCTTSIESKLIGTPSIYFTRGENPQFHFDLPGKMSIECSSFAEVHAIILKRAQLKRSRDLEFPPALGDYFPDNSITPHAISISRSVHQLAESLPPWPKSKRRLRNFLLARLVKFPTNSKFSSTSTSEVRAIERRISGIALSQSKMSVKRVAHNVFTIEKK